MTGILTTFALVLFTCALAAVAFWGGNKLLGAIGFVSAFIYIGFTSGDEWMMSIVILAVIGLAMMTAAALSGPILGRGRAQ